MPKRRAMRPKRAGGKIKSVKIGPKHTEVTIRLPTKRLGIMVARARGKKR